MSATPDANPLAKYFRVPGLNVHLPTEGRFFPKGAFEMGADDAVPVLPMRAADELLLKNPDALMSGYAIEKLLESCVPSIKSPKLTSAPDLDVLLLGIRAATYGNIMEIQATCPKCQHANAFDCDLGAIIQNITPVPDDNEVRLSDDVIVTVRPYNLDNSTTLSLATFTETRKVQALELDEMATDEMRTTQMNTSMEILAKIASDMTARCIIRVVTPDGITEEPSFLGDFFQNIPRNWAQLIEDKVVALNNSGVDKHIDVKCEKCKNEWQTTVEFDPANFFAPAS